MGTNSLLFFNFKNGFSFFGSCFCCFGLTWTVTETTFTGGFEFDVVELFLKLDLLFFSVDFDFVGSFCECFEEWEEFEWDRSDLVESVLLCCCSCCLFCFNVTSMMKEWFREKICKTY